MITPRILYFGTPVVLLSTENSDGSANLAPISSAWALGWTLVLGLGEDGHTARNLAERPDLVVNLPGAGQWAAVERLAPLTGADPVPAGKQSSHRHVRDKFGAAGLAPIASVSVRPPRVAECPLQLEARTERIDRAAADGFFIVQARVLTVHADPSLVIPGTQHVDPARWHPLIYNFRHYFGLGRELGHSYRSETPRSRLDQGNHPNLGPRLRANP
ncbi:flavin reductase family protein [Hamadaea tsunoensis]|uniref:flavin reductase family protein n=1 Tax=Hamadaea tsunoensis TaxID=53368 RepID=UPI00068826F9|nr:flavin reductase family protein [Hamadaea tsunoensis]